MKTYNIKKLTINRYDGIEVSEVYVSKGFSETKKCVLQVVSNKTQGEEPTIHNLETMKLQLKIKVKNHNG